MNKESTKQKVINKVNLNRIDYEFEQKPLLVSGMAMLYYGLRKSSKDIDLIVSEKDHKNLALYLKEKGKIVKERYHSGYKDTPLFVNLHGDHGILIYEFEIWDKIMKYDYEYLKESAVKEKEFLVIGLKKLLFLCTMRGAYKQRYLDDAVLIAKKMSEERYKNFDPQKDNYWEKLL